MRKVVVADEKRKGKTEFNKQDKAKYNEQYFRMYGGDLETVTLLCENEMANVIIDQFGKDAKLRRVDDKLFSVRVDVVVSSHFFGWIVGLGGKVRIISPQNVLDEFNNSISCFI